MDDDILIRAAGPADAATVVDITQAAYQQHTPKTADYAYVFEETPASLIEEMQKPNFVVLLLEKAGEPVAVIRTGLRDPEEMHLWRLGVLPEHQGKGYSKILIEVIERWAAAWGRPWVGLGALEASPENREMYERWGYSVYDRKEMGNALGKYYTLLRKPTARLNEQTTQAYEVIADNYAQRHQDTRAWLEPTLETWTAALPVPARVLEIGSGTGQEAEILTQHGYQVIALDRPMAFLRIAQQRHSSLVQADARSLPFVYESVDGVWAQASLLHMSRLEIAPVLIDIRRVLRPNGIFFCSFKMGHGGVQNPDGRAFTYYQPEEIQRLLVGTRFEIINQSIVPDNRGAEYPDWIRVIARKQ